MIRQILLRKIKPLLNMSSILTYKYILLRKLSNAIGKSL